MCKILSSSEVTGCLPQIPQLASMVDSLYKSNYAQFFLSLADVEQNYLLTNPILAPHARYYVREMRIKGYTQLLESYRSLTMERMCRSFGVSEAFIDADLSRFIASGRINCTIDKVDGVITTNKLASQNKTAMYEQIIKQGDILLSGKSDTRRANRAYHRHSTTAPCRGIDEIVDMLDMHSHAMQRAQDSASASGPNLANIGCTRI
jgi:hypothetical protein